ncbi:MAG: GNAT family N-acetyltransferase [Anaerolineae bacterium]|nr:GNAT family N-acetyltransferase [Anaerolineae bacterium]
MHKISIVEREMTPVEFAQMNAGFDENTLDNDVVIQSSERMGFVALDGDGFIGCVSGLAYKNGDAYSGWFYLTDLYVEKAFRGQGLGAKLLETLEDKILACGIDKVWTWTAGYEGPGFYKKQGYTVFAELENWYSSGHSRVGMKKRL